jgi:selenocysteine lyase/cysteine desulfurase
MGQAARFHESIGRDRIEARVREVAGLLREGISERVAGVRFHTPLGTDTSGGVLVFEWPGIDPRGAFQTLYDEHDVACAPRTGSFPGIRLSPHVYNTMDDVEKVLGAVESIASA